MATFAQIAQVAHSRASYLDVLSSHTEQPDGTCACGDPSPPCIWALTAMMGVAACERRMAEFNAGVGVTAAASPLALHRALAAA